MRKNHYLFLGAVLFAPIALLAALYGDVPDAKHAWAVHDWNRPKPARVTPAKTCAGAPSDAIVLFDGTQESLQRNWRDRKGAPTRWSYSPEGYFYVRDRGQSGGGIYSRAEFGDCQLHIEFRHDPKNLYKNRGPQMRGNSGVFLMDNYEVQVLESYHTSREDCSVDNYTDGQAGSIYGQNPPLVNPARPAGEWQTYDIIFHQPVWEGNRLVHTGSVTVFFNGVLVQDHWELEGFTSHCRRTPLKPHATKGPLSLQDHGCVVHYRNIWYRPLASRWANTTHSEMSAKPEEVMSLRRATAAKLYGAIANPKEVSARNLKALAEVVSYANEGRYADDFKTCLEAYRKAPGPQREVNDVNRALDVLIRGKVIPGHYRISGKK
jgi:hypothetical protein